MWRGVAIAIVPDRLILYFIAVVSDFRFAVALMPSRTINK